MCSTSLFVDGAARSALLLQARKGDRESLAKLILPYAPCLYLGALRLTRNPADAEDVRQDAFLKAMTRLEQFAGTPGENRDDLHAWVSRIAANASIDVIRKRRDGKLCATSCSIRRRKLPRGWGFRRWRCGSGSSERAGDSGKS